MPDNLDLYLQRNEDWSRSLFLTADGEPIDLTGMTVAMQVRDRLTDAYVTSATCTIADAPGGKILVTLKGSVPPLSTYGAPIQDINLRHDIRITESDGYQTVLWSGVLVLMRGVTQ